MAYTLTIPLQQAKDLGLLFDCYKPYTISGEKITYKFRYRNKQVQFACELANLAMFHWPRETAIFLGYS